MDIYNYIIYIQGNYNNNHTSEGILKDMAQPKEYISSKTLKLGS